MPIPLLERVLAHGDRPAVLDAEGRHPYTELIDASARAARRLLAGRSDLGEGRVAFLTPPGAVYPTVQWGIWRAGGVAVPLSTLHPPPELAYTVEDSGAEIVVGHPGFEERLRPVAEAAGRRYLSTAALLAPAGEPAGELPDVEAGRRATIVYTSGTTSRPKGAVTSHAAMAAQISSLVEAWGWRADDRILLALPLHHVHGIVNVAGCAQWSGALCEMPPGFDAERVWERFASGELTLFMAVPTIYRRLIAVWEEAPESRRRRWSEGARRLRLMVSGSAALPVPTLERWREIAGHTLLERYGMTETGMILSNPLDGERRPGCVGAPLPGVEVRRVDEGGEVVEDPATPAEVEVRGPGLFREYWGSSEATADAFRDGWFRTGDVAVVEEGSYRLLGRKSVDIVKTGGYKVSALEVEEVLRTHPAIAECAVVGVPDPEWGERVAVAVELADGGELTLDELRAWARERLAVYKVPSRLRVVETLPRNALGKVVKPELAKSLAGAAPR
ncbi:MAG: acyl-CoA synthetase [Thermoanaerobaculia bacterium]|nr:acyl-CoA synthetase [Thermoanaerobaculia bacterium]